MKTEWISVKEKLPEFGIPVLCVGRVRPFIGRYVSIMNNHEWRDDDFEPCYVSYWMPLPEPPTQ